jgi:hypothetical protein
VIPTVCDGYNEPRIWIEAQSWWMHRGTPITEVSGYGHVHGGACVPHMQQVSGVVPVDVRIVLHHHPGTVWAINPILIYAGEQKHSGHLQDLNFECPATDTCEFWQRVNIDTRDAAVDGRMDVRIRVISDTPTPILDNNQNAVMRFMMDARNGKTLKHRADSSGDIRPAGHYVPEVGYVDFGIDNGADAAKLYQPWSGSVTLHVSSKSTGDEHGAGTVGWNVTYNAAYIDPDFHHGHTGITLFTATPNAMGENSKEGVSRSITIDTTQLANGAHRLVLVGAAETTEKNFTTGEPSTIWGLTVFQFTVQN